MARITDPLFSRAASGRIGTALLFRAGKSGPRVSRPPDPRRTNQAPPSTAQAAVRARYSAAADAWRALAPEDREQWNADARATGRNLHGWALYLERWHTDHPPRPPCDDGQYVPPPADAIIFPGVSCIIDHPYTPPPADAIDFP